MTSYFIIQASHCSIQTILYFHIPVYIHCKPFPAVRIKLACTYAECTTLIDI